MLCLLRNILQLLSGVLSEKVALTAYPAALPVRKPCLRGRTDPCVITNRKFRDEHIGQAHRQQLGVDFQGVGLSQHATPRHATVDMPKIGLNLQANVPVDMPKIGANSSRVQAHSRGILDDTSVEHGVPQVWCVAHGLGQNHWLCPRVQSAGLGDVAGVRRKFRGGHCS